MASLPTQGPYRPPPALDDDERDRLRTRALAKWFMAAARPARQATDPDGVRSELRDHGGHWCVVVVAGDGRAVARYRVINRRSRWYLRREPVDEGLPGGLMAGADLVASYGLGVFTRSARLRDRSAALTARAAGLRLDSAAALTHARYWITRLATTRGRHPTLPPMNGL